MKINEKKIKILLESIESDMHKAYQKSKNNWCDTHIQSARGKLNSLLTIIEFEE